MENLDFQLVPQGSFSKAYSLTVFVIVILTIISRLGRKEGISIPGAPVVGAQSRWEPLLITKYRFPFGGWAVVYQGYKQFKNDIFTIVRPESTVTVLPRKYVNELQNVPDAGLNPISAIARDLMGKYTGINILVGSHLGFTAVQKKLNPKLASFNDVIEEELDHAIKSDFPYIGEDWVKIDLNHMILRIVSRVTARIFVGLPLCRHDEWLSLNASIVEEIFVTMFVIRLFPPFLHPIVSICLPSQWRLRSYMHRIHSLLIPVIDGRRKMEREHGNSYKKPEDIIQWMMDLANEQETDAANLASRYVYTILGSMHTVRSAIIDTLYDICAHPEYLQPLRDEIGQALREDGHWQKGTAAKLLKTDSFMKEVQRLNPPSALGFKRIVREPMTLSDGLHLHKDTYVCVVTTSHLQDEVAPPGSFDGFRYYKKGLEAGTKRYQYSSTDSDHMHLGHGRYACPGRFIASTEIKMVLARILLSYDLKFPEGQGRPENRTVLELSFQDPAGRIMLRQRV